jgi:hypothetical protein
LKKIFFGLLNALPLPPNTRFHQAAAAAKLAAAAAATAAVKLRVFLWITSNFQFNKLMVASIFIIKTMIFLLCP